MGGASFGPPGPGTTGTINFLVVDPLNPSTLYAGRSFGGGIFKSTNAGTSWSAMNNGLTIPDVKALLINPVDPSTLYVGASSHFDAFVTKLNPSGTALVYSTYLGGRFDDIGFGIAVDAAGNAYVAGEAISDDFPISNSLQPTIGGFVDAFVAKLNTTGSALIFSTYLGGSGIDVANAIALDSSANVFVTGYTQSTDFPIVDSLQPSLRGTEDAFVAKLNASGSILSYSTYFGGDLRDGTLGIALSSAGVAYVAGYTNSTNFPVTPGAFQGSTGGSLDAFVAKISEQPPFDTCLQDESSGATLLVNTTSGDYLFLSCRGLLLTGTSSITRRGCLVALQVNGPDRRVLAKIDTCLNNGTASIQILSEGTFAILDRNTRNNSCTCSP